VTEVNFGSCAHYIGGGAHCPLIKGLPPIRAWGGGLGHFDQAHLEINSNTLVCSQVQIVASHELCFLVACCSAHVCLAFCRGTKVSELRAVACMRWATCVSACGWEPGRLLSTGP
jgi:hypothetical protein